MKIENLQIISSVEASLSWISPCAITEFNWFYFPFPSNFCSATSIMTLYTNRDLKNFFTKFTVLPTDQQGTFFWQIPKWYFGIYRFFLNLLLNLLKKFILYKIWLWKRTIFIDLYIIATNKFIFIIKLINIR